MKVEKIALANKIKQRTVFKNTVRTAEPKFKASKKLIATVLLIK